MSRDAHRVTSQIVQVCSQAERVLGAIVQVEPASGVPTTVPVRLVHCWHHGKPSRSFTTVRDPRKVPLSEVVTLSARRWERELAFRRSSRFTAGAACWA
jgi:hypothetical protein